MHLPHAASFSITETWSFSMNSAFLKWEQAEKVEISYHILFSLLDEAFGVRQSFLECLQDSKVVFESSLPLCNFRVWGFGLMLN